MLHWLKTVVVSDEEKAPERRQVGTGKTNASESLLTCRNATRRHQNRGLKPTPGWVWRVPVYWPGDVRHGGDVNPVCGFRMEQEKARLDTARRALAGERECPKQQKL
ncbi:hypothetical protein GCM10009574_002220 [Streptomyces asiaticus]|uniref:Uncharacterized protein n=2 Tax=Streptomyces rhizosphaericus TaxID=114699 RepID=A0ABP4CVH8_9ACTN